MQQRLSQNPRINMEIPLTWWQTKTINGFDFLFLHGEDIKAWNGIPYYRIDRADARYTKLLQMQKAGFHYFCIGHHHNQAQIDSPVGEKIVNGNWVGGTGFSLKQIMTSSIPSQLLFLVHPQKGKSITQKIRLDFSSEENPIGNEQAFENETIQLKNGTDGVNMFPISSDNNVLKTTLPGKNKSISHFYNMKKDEQKKLLDAIQNACPYSLDQISSLDTSQLHKVFENLVENGVINETDKKRLDKKETSRRKPIKEKRELLEAALRQFKNV